MRLHRATHRTTCQRTRRGFTMVELLIAASIGASLLLGLAAVAHLFSAQLTEVRDETDLALDEALVTLTRDVRHAWAVEEEAGGLTIVDPYGSETDYYLQDGALVVDRPTGATGPLLAGVEAFDLSLTTTPRYREKAPWQGVHTCWSSPASTAPAGWIQLMGGDAVAIGFTLPVNAAASFDEVDGVDEQLQSTTLTRLLLPVGWLDAANKQFCHLHASPPHSPNHPSGQATVALELYEARMPGDARPLGPLLAATRILAGTLPPATYVWWDTVTNTQSSPPNGVAWGWWTWFEDNFQVELKASAPTTTASIDLTAMHATLEPGRAYTLVLRLTGADQLLLQTRALSTSKLSGVAKLSGSSFVPQAYSITSSLEGNDTITQTEAHDVVTGVAITLTLQDGRTVSGSANVLGQLAVDEPWLGAVAGELPALQLEGS
jgi:prepilin-type N-terminal cleavage/methylation domain-containing protein